MASTIRTIVIFLAASVQAEVNKRSAILPSRASVPAQAPCHTMSLQFALRFSYTAQIEEDLKRLSSPDSICYLAGSSYISIATTVEKANELLDAEFLYYDVEGMKKLRTTRYSVPEELDQWVELVNPTTYFGFYEGDEIDFYAASEANLDAQFLDAIVKTLPLQKYITGGSSPFVPNIEVPDDASNTNEPYLEFYNYLLEKQNEEIPQVISILYDDDEESVPEEYAVRLCSMMGMRGVTLLHASGDLGIGASCESNDGETGPIFMPQFPGTCPWATSVGGTQFSNPEVGWVAAGAGFSEYVPQPWHQKSDISDVHTNFSARGFPDITAHNLSPPYYYFSSGVMGYAGGTSAATPVVGGLVVLLNDVRLRKGFPVMGFINPWLCANAGDALKDIQEGRVIGCEGTNYQSEGTVEGQIIPHAPWNSTEGCDPPSGLGIPSFADMLKVAIKGLENRTFET
ncbi:subtilisin-like protein [Zalerion maritima]|uniref:Subtilisin-like protein n=1 Tax=Zalerion maritima TaxID=339359 RepID=A0AAD5S0B6_9PEZI|nr:subtilisin-like protein [Zalerion maritima]